MRLSLVVACLLAALAVPALAEVPAPSVPAEDYPQGRLPDLVAPQAYRLDLTIDPDKDRFSGTSQIDAVLKAPTTGIFLHGRDLVLHKAEVRVGGRIFIGTWVQPDPYGVARLAFGEPLPAGPVTFVFDWDAPFNDGPAGLYRVKVDGRWHVWSQFQSIDARAAFPSFDEPGIKTPFTVTLRTPPGLMAISNAPEAGKALEGGLEVHRFVPTLPLPTYLVAVVVGPFASVAGDVAPTQQRAHPLPLRVVSTRPNAEKLDFALRGSQDIVALLEDYFEDGFPYPKLDQITSPIMPGAMENAGADIYGDSILVMDDAAPVDDRRRFGMVVAHELAHQWFGDLVTPAWWDDIWLNESFANWMGYRIGQQWRADLNIGAGALAEGFEAMETDALSVGRPIRQPIASNAQIDGAFDKITYGKGGHVVAMIAAYMGDERFRNGVRRYMAAHRYGNATSNDFFAAMAQAAGNPRILPAMQSFTDQQGVPLVTLSGRSGRYDLRQSRYVPLGAKVAPARWGVPVCLRAGTARECLLLDGLKARATLSATEPVMPNSGGTGYYRFEMPRREWRRLIEGSATLPSGEALALSDSLEASFRAGRAPFADLVALARTMVRNPDPYAAQAATAPLRRLSREGIITGKGLERLRAFLAGLNAPALAGYGFDPRLGAYAGEGPDRRQSRARIVAHLAYKGDDERLAATLREAAGKWLDGDADALDPEWYDLGFGAWLEKALSDGLGLEVARKLVDRALASDDPAFRPSALAAVSGTDDPVIARWLLDDLNDPRMRSVERFAIAGQIMKGAQTREYGYGWLKANMASWLKGSSGIFLATRMPAMLSGFCSSQKAVDIERDFTPLLRGTRAELALARTVEVVRNCGVLKNARGAESSAAARRLR